MGNTEIEIVDKKTFFDKVRSVDSSDLYATNYPSIGFQCNGSIEIILKQKGKQKEVHTGSFSDDFFREKYGFILKIEE